MTKEEAVNILNGYMSGRIDAESTELYHAIELVVDILELQPSLSSNLDEAALNAYPKMSRLSETHGVIPADNKSHYLGDANEDNRNAFKAGAEWMAGQGYTKEGIARPDDCEIWVNFTDTDIKDGDEVIVQIRKK